MSSKFSKYLLDHQIKGFHNIVQQTSFYAGAKSMIEVTIVAMARMSIITIFRSP